MTILHQNIVLAIFVQGCSTTTSIVIFKMDGYKILPQYWKTIPFYWLCKVLPLLILNNIEMMELILQEEQRCFIVRSMIDYDY